MFRFPEMGSAASIADRLPHSSGSRAVYVVLSSSSRAHIGPRRLRHLSPVAIQELVGWDRIDRFGCAHRVGATRSLSHLHNRAFLSLG